MREWLRCDLHIHTNYSDGRLSPKEVIDLYGEHKFDVLGITDHMSHGKMCDHPVIKDEFPHVRDYFDHITELKEYAWLEYHMILIHGLEMGNYKDRWHVLALNVNRASYTWDLEKMVKDIQKQGGLAIAAHPGKKHRETEEEWDSKYLWEHMDELRTLFDAWEVGNRDDLYNFTGLKKKKFAIIAGSDFHKKSHVYSWKTAVRAERNVLDISRAIKENDEVSIFLYRK